MNRAYENIIRREEVIGWGLNSAVTKAHINLATSGSTLDSANVSGRSYRYHTLTLKFLIDGVPATVTQMEKLKNIKLTANVVKENGAIATQVLREYANGKHLFIENEARGFYVQDGYLDLHFTNFLCKTNVEQGTEALGTADITKLVFDATLDNSGLTNPSVKLLVSYDGIYEKMGIIRITKHVERKIDGAGYHGITQTDADLIGEGVLQNITLFSDGIDNVKMEINKERIDDISHDDYEYLNKNITRVGRNKIYKNTSKGIYIKDFALNSIGNGIPMIGKEFKISLKAIKLTNPHIYYHFIQGYDDKRVAILNNLER